MILTISPLHFFEMRFSFSLTNFKADSLCSFGYLNLMQCLYNNIIANIFKHLLYVRQTSLFLWISFFKPQNNPKRKTHYYLNLANRNTEALKCVMQWFQGCQLGYT